MNKRGLNRQQAYNPGRRNKPKFQNMDKDNPDYKRMEKVSSRGEVLFLNPYNFVDVSGPTPKYPLKTNEKFHSNSGYIEVEIKTVSPLFIPSPGENIYIINDDMLEDNNRRVISKFCREFLDNHDGFTQIYFMNDFSKWKEEKTGNRYQKFLKKRTEGDKPESNEWIPGCIRKMDKKDSSPSFELVSGLPFNGAHKKMKFFHYHGMPLIPSTSSKGLLRSTVEILSNSCFPHDYTGNTILNFMCHRLNVADKFDSNEIRRLRPGILKKKGEQWYFIELDQARVLTVIDNYTHDSSQKAEGEKLLFAAKNKKGEIEKIGTKSSTGGINGYIEKKRRTRDFFLPMEIKHFKPLNYQIAEINGERLDKPVNQYNKKFPYIDLASQKPLIPCFYAIIRKKQETNTISLFKVKEISDNIADLQALLTRYRNPRYNKDGRGVQYDICQVFLKTSFDIETKTQDQLFFKFGVRDLMGLKTYVENCVKRNKAILIDEKVFKQFQNLISQRFENLAQRHKNNPLLKFQPSVKDIRDGMLVYYYPFDEPYLTYTQVARKPHRYGIAEILDKMEKTRCSRLEALCPACNMFGGVNITAESDHHNGPRNNHNSNNKKTTVSIGGKISVGFGKCLKHNGFEEGVILKPLGEPHPGFFQFYVLDNRKTANDTGKNKHMDYDTLEVKLGRKVYLKHDPDTLDYRDNRQSRLNVTVQLLKQGAVFCFRIHYFNLSHYELGLLLNSLDIQHNGRRLDNQLGMGKPLGLGRIKIDRIQVTRIDREKRYSSLTDEGKIPMSELETAKYINIFQRIQTAVNGRVFDPDSLNEADIANYEIKPVPGFADLPYVKEYTLLKQVNDGIALKFPIMYPAKKEKKKEKEDSSREMKGFKWFMEEKENVDQRLFHPFILIDAQGEEIAAKIPLYNWGQECKK